MKPKYMDSIELYNLKTDKKKQDYKLMLLELEEGLNETCVETLSKKQISFKNKNELK
jgi:hypothetical protein